MPTAPETLLNELADIVSKEGASDLHLSEGRSPIIRVSGFLMPLTKYPVSTKEEMEGFVQSLLSEANKEELKINNETNLSWNDVHGHRFRCNVYVTMGRISIAMRFIPEEIKSFEALGLPPILANFARKQQGFFLVVGPVGVGKSTTLASIVETINSERLDHIVTIEDPIEYVFKEKKSLIDQREVKIDTPDFHTALRGVFRQDADVVMIGEMRDKETISAAVTAAETGHLIISTLHTNTAAQTIDRIIDTFPADQQGQIRLQLSSSLLGIFSQRLVPRISGGLVPAFELLINNNAVSNLIRERRTHEIQSVIETGAEEGMIDLNRSLADLVRRGEITVETAIQYSNNPRTLERML